MNCLHNTWKDNASYFNEFHRRIWMDRVPISGSVALTHRCNLSCIHCYLPENRTPKANNISDIPKEKLFTYLDQIADAGCLYLLFTGGEPLLHPDFDEIYTYAKHSGFLITVFSNGIAINDARLELFEEMPPQCLDITIYGATEDTYSKICRRLNCFRNLMQTLESLSQKHIPFKLKTILMTENQSEWRDIEAIATSFNRELRMDPVITPRMNGDPEPLKYRAEPAAIVEMELSSRRRFEKWVSFSQRMETQLRDLEELFECGAGMTTFHIDVDGMMYPCLMLTHPGWDLKRGSFLKGWKNLFPKIRYIKKPIDMPCRSCKLKCICGYCPALFGLENGREDLYSEFICRLGHVRYEAMLLKEGKKENAKEQSQTNRT